MATTPNSLVTVQTPRRSSITITNGNGTVAQTVFTGSANGSKITALVVTSNDPVARALEVGIASGATLYPLGTVLVGTTAGVLQATGTAVDILGSLAGLPVDNDGQHYIFLNNASDLLQAQALSTVTVTSTLYVTAIGGDF